jgi:hypothetical protein
MEELGIRRKISRGVLANLRLLVFEGDLLQTQGRI